MIGPQTPPEPRHTRDIACRDAAFRMNKLRRPLELCKISGLNSTATLLPCCLRLALPVTRQHPRLANGGSLRFAVRVFHPLNHPPFSGRTYSLTDPIVIPFTKYFWKKGYAARIGRIPNTAIAILTVVDGSADESSIPPVVEELFARKLIFSFILFNTF